MVIVIVILTLLSLGTLVALARTIANTDHIYDQTYLQCQRVQDLRVRINTVSVITHHALVDLANLREHEVDRKLLRLANSLVVEDGVNCHHPDGLPPTRPIR